MHSMLFMSLIPSDQPKWGPTHSVSDDEDDQNNKKPPISPGFAGTQLFKTSKPKKSSGSPSRSSHYANNSNHTHPTEPTTVGANSQSSTGNTNAAKVAATNGSFWNFNVRAADSSDNSGIKQIESTNSSTLSNPAKAAADAASAVMMGMLSRANEFMTTSSASSLNNHRVSPSPTKKIAMEGIPEDKECGNSLWGGFCANDNACFTDFGFNPFSGDDEGKGGGANNLLSTPPKGSSPTGSTMKKQHEIRLTSSYRKEPEVDDKKLQDGVVTPDVDEYVPSGLGFDYIELPSPQDLERSVSELTMRSIGAYARDSRPSDSRRMAYYAVGRAGDGKSSGNRRCYFTGTAIPYATPFYAGCVQQGPRTLVVFCLPSALGLPTMSANSQSKEDRERYLQSLPHPDAQLLREMKRRYSEPFETLPSQVRSPVCWQLFVKFCFFSGLPIAEGEMHYRVKSTVNVIAVHPADSNSIPEEISLSHEVMEAVNGKVSAEILRLPNQKTFDYIRTQYSQQSAKLNAEVFDRKSWEMVMPEV